MRLKAVAAAYGIWLLSIEIIFYATHGQDTSAIEYAAILGIVPLSLQFLLLGLNPYGLVSPARFALVFLLIVVLSYLSHASDVSAITYTLEVVFIFTVSIIFAGCPDPRLIREVATFVGVPNALFLLYVDFNGKYLWGRLVDNGMEPNWWGLMATWAATSAFAYRSRILGAFCFGVGLLTMYYSSSRGSMLGILAAVLVIGSAYLPRMRGPRLAVIAGVVAVVGLGVLLNAEIASRVTDFVANDVFKVDDPYRGMGQGFTGRTSLWQESIDVWERAPIFGVGFREHELYLTGHTNAHNAFVAMLADTGAAGLIWYLVFIGLSLVAALRLPDARARATVVATIVAYIVIGFFERRAINGGNPLALFFLICCSYALAQRQWRNALAGAGGMLAQGGRPVFLTRKPAG